MSSTMRFGFSLPLAAIVATFLFWVMPALISTGVFDLASTTVRHPFAITMPDRDETPALKDRLKPERPEPVERPLPPDPGPADSPVNGVTPLVTSPPQVDTGDRRYLPVTAPTDGQAVAILKTEPQYPDSAARNGIEGWVRLGFTVNETGRCEDITVLAGEPTNVFDRAAVRALERWRYRPKIEGGRPVKQYGQQVVITFKLEKS